VAFALAGTTRIDLTKEPLGTGKDGKPVYLADIWPSTQEIKAEVEKVVSDMFRKQYAEVFDGDAHWQALEIPDSLTYEWREESTYVANPPFFDGIDKPAEPPKDIKGARVLAVFGDTITTDHISPAGAIKPDSPAGKYLQEQGVAIKDFNSYGSRRGNHEVMMRGTFANIRIKNLMIKGSEGGVTRHVPSGKQMSIYDAAMRYQEEKTPLVVLAGKEYGTGSSRDWAAKGTRLLGVSAVIAESYERIHRSNLVGMGVLPLQFQNDDSAQSLGLDGSEEISLTGLSGEIKPGQEVQATARKDNGDAVTFKLTCRIDTLNEVRYFLSGGILHHVLREMMA
jgi:aconitate hydratase